MLYKVCDYRSAFGSDPNQQGSSAYISMKCDALGDTGCSRSILKTPIQVTFGGTPVNFSLFY